MVNSLRPIIHVDAIPIGMDLVVMHSAKDRQLVPIQETVLPQELASVTRIITEQAARDIVDQKIAYMEHAMEQDFVLVMTITLKQIAVFFAVKKQTALPMGNAHRLEIVLVFLDIIILPVDFIVTKERTATLTAPNRVRATICTMDLHALHTVKHPKRAKEMDHAILQANVNANLDSWEIIVVLKRKVIMVFGLE